MSLSGQALPAKYPTIAAAAAVGALSADHVVAAAKALDALPDDLPEPKVAEAELIVTGLARVGTCADIDAAGRRLLDHLDPDGDFRDLGPTAKGRNLHLGTPGPDGLTPIRGHLTPALRELLLPTLEALARKGRNNPDDTGDPADDPWHTDDGDPLAEAAGRDRRSTPQRMHDALVVIAETINASGTIPEHRALAAVPIITMTLTDLERRAGQATTFTGGTLTISEALRLAATNNPHLAVFADMDPVPLWWGRQRRLATPTQRLALFTAHRGCTFPGCSTAAAGCEVHHAAADWADGATTDITTVTLACPTHHKLTQQPHPQRWHTAIVGAHHRDRGKTAWIPPAAYDPTRTPRLSRTQDPPGALRDATAHTDHTYTPLTWDDLTPSSRQKLGSAPVSDLRSGDGPWSPART